MTPSAHGPDLSHWNRVVSESAIPHFPIASCKLTEGRSALDPAAAAWVNRFHRLGIPHIGVYHWLRSDSPMVVQFANVVTRLGQIGLAAGNSLARGAFLQLDWETTPGIPDLTVAQVEDFVDLAERRYGERIIVYASDWVPGFKLWRNRNPDTPLWYANYRLGDSVDGGQAECKRYNAAVWQWTSTYKCPGIADGIDMNHVFDWAVIDRLCAHPVQTPDPPQPPIPIPIPIPIPPQRTARAIFAATGDDMLRIIADANQPNAPQRWVTNGMVRVEPTEHSCAWLERTGQLPAGNSIRTPEFLDPLELAGLPLVNTGGQ